MMNKRERSETFRNRLAQALERQGMSRSALARAAGVDRSTVTQILDPEETRMPNAHLAAAFAAALGVSADWLLGLSDRPETAGDLLASAMSLTEADVARIDERVVHWHREAEGFKIRHVPAALPDLIKTDAVMHWEYGVRGEGYAERAIAARAEILSWLSDGTSDYEIAFPRHQIEAFARAEGYYRGLALAARLEGLGHMRELAAALYPRLRISIFDSPRLYSAPLTVFGPRLAVVFLGRFHLAFRDAERIRALSAHFDWLVRDARVDPSRVPAFLDALTAEIRGVGAAGVP